MFTIGTDEPTINKYSLSTPWDISTALYAGISFNTNLEDNDPQDLFFKPDGSKFYVVGDENNNVYQYEISNVFYFLEIFNPERTLDSSKTGGAASQIEMQHLFDETLRVITDDIVQANVAVSSTSFSADDDGIFTLQTNLTSGELTLDGAFVSSGTASFNGVSRHIIIEYSAMLSSGDTITITGTDFYDNVQTETITTVFAITSYPSLNKFKTVTNINQPITSASVTLKIGVSATTTDVLTFASPSTTSFEVEPSEDFL